MSEDCSSGNDCDKVVPNQHQNYRIISYLIASLLDPHNMRYVTVDSDLCRLSIKKTDNKYCHNHSYSKNFAFLEDKVHNSCSKEMPSVSPQGDKVRTFGSLCVVRRRNCPSDVNEDLIASSSTIDLQEINASMPCEENIISNAGKSVSSLDIETRNFKSYAFQCLSVSDKNMEAACQKKSLCIRSGFGKCFCTPIHEKSAEDLQSEENILQEKESSNGNSGLTQQQMDSIFLKTCRCRICGQCFTDVFSLNFHIYKGHEKTARPTCVRCSAKFVSLYTFFQHLMQHKKLLLKQKARMTKQLQGPWSTCNNELNFSCFDGNRIHPLTKTLNGELQNQNLEAHLTIPCGVCGKEYKHKKTLMAHMKFKHLGVQKKVYKCGFCLQLFSSLWQRNNHLSWRHLGRKPYLCQFCDQGFVCLPTLKRHQRKIHTGEKPYKCFHCGQSFFEKTPLDLHKAQMHTGVFPFVCSQCGRGFVQHCSLKKHWKTHAGLFHHKCLVCGKSYTKISHLKRHKVSCGKNPGSKTLINVTHFQVK